LVIGFKEESNFMRSADVTQAAMFSYRTLEERIPREHPLRKLRSLVDGILVTLHAEFEALYAGSGRPSIPPERLLRASLIQTLRRIFVNG
jgi:transposase